jgi:hypothetical protein
MTALIGTRFRGTRIAGFGLRDASWDAHTRGLAASACLSDSPNAVWSARVAREREAFANPLAKVFVGSQQPNVSPEQGRRSRIDAGFGQGGCAQ